MFFINIMNKQTFKLNPVLRKNCTKDTKDKQIHSQFILQNCIISIRHTLQKNITASTSSTHQSPSIYTRFNSVHQTKRTPENKPRAFLTLKRDQRNKERRRKNEFKKEQKKKIYKHIYIKREKEKGGEEGRKRERERKRERRNEKEKGPTRLKTRESAVFHSLPHPSSLFAGQLHTKTFH